MEERMEAVMKICSGT